MPRVAHLVARFFGSLRPPRVDATTLAWVQGVLTAGEWRVWDGLGRADRAESVAVARRLEADLAGTPGAHDDVWVAAALVHDVGKQASAFGPVGRALVTMLVAARGSERVRGWVHEPGRLRARIGTYAAHDEVGAELLRVAGARPEAVSWAAAHHRPGRWAATGFPPGICAALARADGEPELG